MVTAKGTWVIKDGSKNYSLTGVSRDQVVAAIYETVIQPDLYDVFMDAWGEHIQSALEDPSSNHGVADGEDALQLDPELQAHFARAYDILEQIGRKAPQFSVLDQVRQSAGFSLLARPDGQILAMGKAAVDAMQGQNRLSALEDMLTANSAVLLQDLLRSAKESDPGDASVVLATGGQPRHLIARISQTNDADGVASSLIAIDALSYQWSERAAQMLVTSFGLSPAEVDIVRNLLAGHSLREIAEQSGRSEHTVRNQAKAVLAKTGAPGQVDLIRLVAFLINSYRRNGPAAVSGSDLSYEMYPMASGLEMQVFGFGPKDGHPVIYLHGMLDGVAPLQLSKPLLEKRGFRVFAPIRPGYGQSSPVSDPAEAMELFSGHVDELITGNNLQRPILVGYLAGAIYGYNICKALHRKLGGMVVAGAIAPVTRISQLAEMAPRQRLVAYTARYAPALLPFVLRAGIAQIDSKEIEDFMEALFPAGTHDSDMMANKGLIDVIQKGYRFSVTQGHLGFATDSHFAVRDWSSTLTGLSAPVINLYGALDPVVSQASLKQFIQMRNSVEFRMQKDMGQLIFLEDPDLVLDAIAELIKRAETKS